MFNGNKLNSSGLNSSANALVFISAVAAFSVSTTSDFAGGGFVRKAVVNLQSTVTSSFSESIKILPLELNLGTSPQLYPNAGVNQVITSNWDSNANLLSINTLIETSVDMVANVGLTGYTDFIEADPIFVSSGANFVADGRRGKSIFATYEAAAQFANPLDPQINGLMTGEWTPGSHLWVDATIDTGLGYLELDGYTFWSADVAWDNTSYLTAIFTTGGFIGFGANLDNVPTKTLFNRSDSWNSIAEFEIAAITEQQASSGFSVNTTISAPLLRTAYSLANNWVTTSDFVAGRVYMGRAGYAQLTIGNTLSISTVVMTRRSRTDFSGTVTVTFGGGIIWDQAVASWQADADTNISGHRLFTTTIDFVGGLEIEEINAKRTIYAAVPMAGSLGTLTAAIALRLVDAPLARQFRIPAQDRTFIVPAKGRKYEVAA